MQKLFFFVIKKFNFDKVLKSAVEKLFFQIEIIKRTQSLI